MSITFNVDQKVVERFQNGATTEDLSGYTHTREFRVCVDNPGPAAHHAALNMEGIPRIGDFFPSAPRNRGKKIRFSHLISRRRRSRFSAIFPARQKRCSTRRVISSRTN